MAASIHIGDGVARIGSLTLAAHPTSEGLRVAGRLTLRPLAFGLRSRLVAWSGDALAAAVLAETLQGTCDDGKRPALEVLALHLAGAGSGAPGFLACEAFVARLLGWTRADIAAAEALEVDRLALGLATVNEEHIGWTKVVFASPDSPPAADDLAPFRAHLVADLQRRSVASLMPREVIALQRAAPPAAASRPAAFRSGLSETDAAARGSAPTFGSAAGAEAPARSVPHALGKSAPPAGPRAEAATRSASDTASRIARHTTAPVRPTLPHAVPALPERPLRADDGARAEPGGTTEVPADSSTRAAVADPWETGGQFMSSSDGRPSSVEGWPEPPAVVSVVPAASDLFEPAVARGSSPNGAPEVPVEDGGPATAASPAFVAHARSATPTAPPSSPFERTVPASDPWLQASLLIAGGALVPSIGLAQPAEPALTLDDIADALHATADLRGVAR